MADTIFYKGKLKRGKNPLEVFEKINKSIKKKGPTRQWDCKIDAEKEQLCIVFPDGSENFVLDFNEKGEFNSFCKVYFMDDASEEGKSEFYALIDAIYNAKSMFSKIEVTDDFGLAESYWDSKKFKFSLRELTPEEQERVKRLYSAGHTGHENLLLAIMAEDMKMSIEELMNYINIDCGPWEPFPALFNILETYLYETAAFQKEGRMCEIPEYVYYDLGKVSYSVFAFLEGLTWIFLDGNGYGTSISLEKRRAFSQKDAQVELLFREKFVPEFLKLEDSLEKCLLVYRYFVSVYDFLGFQYVGRIEKLRTKIDEIIEEYGEEKGNIFVTSYCTYKGYNLPQFTEEQKKIYENTFLRRMKERYGEALLDEYFEFNKKYGTNVKFSQEAKNVAKYKMKYIDESLVK